VFLVSQHPEVDEKLFEELSDLLADEGAQLDLNQLSAMTHLNMALKESLRMYPPATSTAREADTDVTIGDKYFIPKGVRTPSPHSSHCISFSVPPAHIKPRINQSPVVIPIKAMGNNPDLWPEPERFLPFDRWAGDEVCQLAPRPCFLGALGLTRSDRRATAKRSTRSCGFPLAPVPATGTCPWARTLSQLHYIT
jgi:hypothetical protein